MITLNDFFKNTAPLPKCQKLLVAHIKRLFSSKKSSYLNNIMEGFSQY